MMIRFAKDGIEASHGCMEFQCCKQRKEELKLLLITFVVDLMFISLAPNGSFWNAFWLDHEVF